MFVISKKKARTLGLWERKPYLGYRFKKTMKIYMYSLGCGFLFIVFSITKPLRPPPTRFANAEKTTPIPLY
jgi:hypothetical protein